MSLKSRKSIDRAGPDRHDETIVTFRREADKTYTKITETMSRDWKTSQIKSMKSSKSIEEGPYVLVEGSKEDFDEKVSYQDIDGQIAYMHFKKIDK